MTQILEQATIQPERKAEQAAAPSPKSVLSAFTILDREREREREKDREGERKRGKLAALNRSENSAASRWWPTVTPSGWG